MNKNLNCTFVNEDSSSKEGEGGVDHQDDHQAVLLHLGAEEFETLL